MRSIYRLLELIDLKSPEILINNEKDILKKYLRKLSPQETIDIIKSYPVYHREQKEQDGLSNKKLTKDFDEYLRDLN